MNRNTVWRAFLARLPLPMLALAASYGVYEFARLFVPAWVAIVQAAAFELTYIGLAVQQGMHAEQRQRATAISIGAVVVSILYNTIAGLLHRNPEWVEAAPWYAEVALAVLHGAPLAWVAYLVADLLLHSPAHADVHVHAPATAPTVHLPVHVPALVHAEQYARATPVHEPVQVHAPAVVHVEPAPPVHEEPGHVAPVQVAPGPVCPSCSAPVNAATLPRIRKRGYCAACKPA
jgi:hypothetical protein